MEDPINMFGQQKARKNSTKEPKPDVRPRRVDEYEKQGLEKPAAFDACLCAIQADQMRISFELGRIVKRFLANGEPTAQDIHELQPSLDFYLRMTRQIERYRQLELRQTELQLNDSAAVKDPLKNDKPVPRNAK